VLFGSNRTSFTVYTQLHMCVYTHTRSSQYRGAGGAKEKISETAVNAALRGNLSA